MNKKPSRLGKAVVLTVISAGFVGANAFALQPMIARDRWDHCVMFLGVQVVVMASVYGLIKAAQELFGRRATSDP